MKKLLRISFLTATIGFSTGCATIVSKSEYPVNITSNPTGVAFEIKNRAGKIVTHGTTPQNVVLKAGAGYFKGEKYEITFTAPGIKKGKKTTRGKKQTFVLDTKLDGWYIGGNLIFGGLLGYLIVDPMTGAMFKLPESFYADLNEGGASSATLNIISIDTLTPEQRANLQPIHL
ncbi:hypothetical protein [Rodentibacter pneumotropicus]|uniref:PEGA domain-containing protein n=1 Tax=Rodentibacter pneumotropicus TaxID=758 RepID=A0A4S2P623_9PAST|nr:hypothetical protein [Rodentibacter pneumotropicus]TGZ98328.1 hypothetical protein D3M79_09565 [Rodentibacter pneumotropicus]THA00852.1 hypothetical protein D3M74_06625 [Rodentibacter pneumotropicus]THA09014.1 hypothetical protein D3M77_03005 [Rodentibacter pneumotropicus]THA13181.1 hypothetical protein D3M76_09195 [Rodentibacter pneumotropicus]